MDLAENLLNPFLLIGKFIKKTFYIGMKCLRVFYIDFKLPG